ncbi:hypothetical protein BT63DRAFT_408895 [Microthyrium microscopicum]|uniref:CFEM domain-containing protein n=1 Tax=Microthyrium microscopicum TaxID=703497 RepID=A0A6A6USI7_9PEZI|nr:hypothetical protein BT63DRAFT_408895 [Microthyrium microscopicum]
MFASTTLAQTQCDYLVSAIPVCAVSCVSAAATSVCGTNGPRNYSCQCASSTALQNSAIGCILHDCTPADADQADKAGSAICSCVSSVGPQATFVPAETTSTPS